MFPTNRRRFLGSAFNCPNCNAFAKQTWYDMARKSSGGSYGWVGSAKVCIYSHCVNASLWLDSKMIHPRQGVVGSPNRDVEDDIQADYEEAARILDDSPRGAAALVRLCIQKPGVEVSRGPRSPGRSSRCCDRASPLTAPTPLPSLPRRRTRIPRWRLSSIGSSGCPEPRWPPSEKSCPAPPSST